MEKKPIDVRLVRQKTQLLYAKVVSINQITRVMISKNIFLMDEEAVTAEFQLSGILRVSVKNTEVLRSQRLKRKRHVGKS
jgi:hypothetical protein